MPHMVSSSARCSTEASTALNAAHADGNYIMCGSEDGYCYLWDVDGGPAMQLPDHFSLQGQPVLCTAWNKVLNMAGEHAA